MALRAMLRLVATTSCRALTLAFVSGLACGDDLADPERGPSAFEGRPLPLRGGEPLALAVPLRRLTREQLHNTLQDLLGESPPAGFDVRELWPPDDVDGGFASNATVPVTELAVEQLERAAERVAAAAVRRRAHLHACLEPADPTAACLAQWIEELAPRALRRPLSPAELESWRALAQPEPSPAGVDEDPVDAAIFRTLSALLQSPDFLYRVEAGEPTDDPEVRRLTAHEIAARLSYLVWSSLPDASLTADADSGRLYDPAARAAQLERMLADPRAVRGLMGFHRQWLELGALDSLDKDRNVFPTFDPALRPLLAAELQAFVEFVILRGDARFATLMSARTTFVPPALAAWYGDDASPTTVPQGQLPGLPEGFVPVALDEQRRAGVLTLVPVMATHAKAGRSDPVGRGALVRRRWLCETLAAAPPDVVMPPVAPTPGSSQRDQLEQHAEDPACAACHARMDPGGLALESYDAMGSSRTHDLAGNPIDARGALPGSDIEGALEGPVALALALAHSEQAQRCYATQWLRYALGRPEGPDDAALLLAVQDRFLAADGHVPTLLRALVVADAFIQRRVR